MYQGESILHKENTIQEWNILKEEMNPTIKEIIGMKGTWINKYIPNKTN